LNVKWCEGVLQSQWLKEWSLGSAMRALSDKIGKLLRADIASAPPITL
jgi:hypothetical protein